MKSPENQPSKELKKTSFLKALGAIALAAAGVALLFGPHGLLSSKPKSEHK